METADCPPTDARCAVVTGRRSRRERHSRRCDERVTRLAMHGRASCPWRGFLGEFPCSRALPGGMLKKTVATGASAGRPARSCVGRRGIAGNALPRRLPVSRFFFSLPVSCSACRHCFKPNINPYRSPPGRQQAGMQPMEISGTIQGVARGGIVVASGNNQMWRRHLPPQMRRHESAGDRHGDGRLPAVGPDRGIHRGDRQSRRDPGESSTP